MMKLSTPGKFDINVPQHAQLPDVVKVLKESGCGLVRLPWNQSDNLGALARQVQRFINGGMKVVVDFHPDGREKSRLALWQLTEVWEKLAAIFAHIAPEELSFHILNEPNAHLCPEFYYRELQKACNTIWVTSPKRLCIFSNHLMGNPDGWTVAPPKGGPVAAAMSYYRPYDVVKEGSDRAYPPVSLGLAKDFPFDDYQNQELHFKVFRDYCDKHKIQPWLSETGCHRDVPGRLQYAKDIKGLGEKYGIPICWWAFRDEYGANPAFGNVKARDLDYWEIIAKP